MNKIELMGRLTKDIEVKGENEKKVGIFTLAVDRKGAKEKTTDFINCVVFGKLIDILVKYTSKGNRIIVCGSLLSNTYTDKEGKNQTKYFVNVNDFYFTETKTKKDEPDI